MGSSSSQDEGPLTTGLLAMGVIGIVVYQNRVKILAFLQALAITLLWMAACAAAVYLLFLLARFTYQKVCQFFRWTRWITESIQALHSLSDEQKSDIRHLQDRQYTHRCWIENLETFQKKTETRLKALEPESKVAQENKTEEAAKAITGVTNG